MSLYKKILFIILLLLIACFTMALPFCPGPRYYAPVPSGPAAPPEPVAPAAPGYPPPP